MPACSSPARAAPARNWSPAPSTATARAATGRSCRSTSPPSIPNLVESELFGHVKGAFTGAAQARPGLLALADGGTVFLDELADIPLPVQVKLLRVLEHNEVLPVGGNQPQPLNIRILAATHQDLARRVAEGSFRHDLFFRLNVFQIHLPPLRERAEDIAAAGRALPAPLRAAALPLLPETVRFLQSLPWLGNVRELRNALEHAAIVARGGPLLPEHFPTVRRRARADDAGRAAGRGGAPVAGGADQGGRRRGAGRPVSRSCCAASSRRCSTR